MTQQLFSVTRTTLSDQIADALEKWILEEAGDDIEKLPAEQTLAERFAVSRNVVRESLNILKARGLIENRNGSGNFITKPDANNVSDIMNLIVKMDKIGFRELYDVRMILEAGACRRAAMRITTEELEELKNLMEQLNDRTLTVKKRRAKDLEFHLGIARFSGNDFLAILIDAMKNVFMENMFLENETQHASRIEKSLQAHQKIWDSLAAGDPEGAAQAVTEHLTESVAHYEENLMKK